MAAVAEKNSDENTKARLVRPPKEKRTYVLRIVRFKPPSLGDCTRLALMFPTQLFSAMAAISNNCKQTRELLADASQ